MTVTFALGPTNTGKTHRAVARMLEHGSGMIGLPLRLLAREVYDRVTAEVGEQRVALVTGEEKRVPPRPAYWVCTVEAMPVARDVDFLAVDEIQLAAHPQRGHVFTDRLLRARGRRETWFMGADTMWSMCHQLVPTADYVRYPRLSRLSNAGGVPLTKLPARTAVIAFSTEQVYRLAERLRTRRGGAAVVLGALSPRTRNAQVAMYQSGEVQYMVATDAIGMGLNLDVDHVAFAALDKYDGRELRPLDAAELAQIAGRAGRYQRNGTFGTVQPLAPLPERLARAIESHRLAGVRRLVWRSSDLDTRSVDALLASLRRPPGGDLPRRELRLVDHADDTDALIALAARPDVRRLAQGREAVELLWDVCQIPDFRRLLEGSHVELLAELYRQLTGPTGYIDADWLRRRIDRLDDIRGDIDALMQRIAFIRTWTYVSNHPGWVAAPDGWRERTRAIEDRLSDALHARLVQRFVAADKADGVRAGQPGRGGRRRGRRVEVTPDNPFHVLAALRVEDAPAEDDTHAWVQSVIDAGHDRFTVDETGAILYEGRTVARMTRGVDLLRPDVALAVDDLPAGARSRLVRRLVAWTRDLVGDVLAPLKAGGPPRLSPAGRGLVYLLEQGLGTVHRRDVRREVGELTAADRRALRELGVHLGDRVVYVRRTLEAGAIHRRAALCAAALPRGVAMPTPSRGQVSLPVAPGLDQARAALYTAIGYPVFGPRAIRADLAERVHAALARAAGRGPFDPPRELSSWLGCPAADLPGVIRALGYRKRDDGSFERGPRGRARSGRRPRRTAHAASPHGAARNGKGAAGR